MTSVEQRVTWEPDDVLEIKWPAGHTAGAPLWSVYSSVNPLLSTYGKNNPNQPRDYHGRWGSGGGAHVASEAEYKAAYQQAQDKIMNAPVPSRSAVDKARAELQKAKEGKGRAGGDSRGGSAAGRRKQRENLFKEFGGEKKGYVVCHGCGTKTHHSDKPELNPKGYAKFERGKIFVKAQGGGYQLPNLLPECFGCNRSRNDQMLRPENAPIP